MADKLISTLSIAGAGMSAQSTRLRTISENIANKDSTTTDPNINPYRRKTTHFRGEIDRNLDAELVKVSQIRRDLSDYRLVFDPNHPAANENGYVKFPNVNPLIELMDMREATRSYEANLNINSLTKTLINQTIDILR